MEQLSLLQKIYLYGETLSSEELNQIVLYLNSSIEAINALIARNNNINEGHCEMRYKVSAQLPEAPESGTDGKSNGWSDTYTRPDTANGEITWMTLSFFNGEGVYGAWSTPVCITWGSVRGQAGPKGESGLRGSFKSRVFKRLNTRPDTPTGGTYDNPVPSEGGWTDGIPAGKAIIWSSVCTFYGNGLSSGWSVPAAESDNDTLDIEFSPNAVQPEPPTGDTPFTNHESEGWYDPSSNNFNIVGTMVWRAERKVSNGVYNGDWTITRIVGEKGDRGDSGLTGGHYEFRYNNFKPSEQASAPTKPETGSNGTTNGWTTSQETLTETLIKDGYATWMTQCYQNEASIYNIWTDPIRITGANGEDGEDGIDIEFVYTRTADLWSNPTPPPTTQTDDWPTNGNNHSATVNGVTWYDNPLGVTEDLMYEYVSLRLKVDDVWSAYSTPVVWSKWGEKGMDGDGYEYIYKKFLWPVTWGDSNTNSDNSTHVQGKNDNPANWSTSASGYLNKEYIYSGSGWTDDPVGIDENYKYEYVSTREYRLWPNETEKRWGAYSTPTLWSGIPGGKTEYRYAKAKSSPTKPDAGTDGTASPWLTSLVSISEAEFKEGYKAWMTQCFKTDAGTYGTWSDPIRISGANGLDGEDGSDIEFIYAQNNTGVAPTAPTVANTGNSNIAKDDWPNINGSTPSATVTINNVTTTWYDNPQGVSENTKYEYVAVREKPAGKNLAWGPYKVALWSKWGEKGMDGDGVLYVFKLFDTELTDAQRTSNIPTKPATMTNNEWIPSGWNDDPPTVSSEHPYCYCSTIKKTNGTWGDFETLSLWAKYAKDSNVAGPDGKGITYIITIEGESETYWTNNATVGANTYFFRNRYPNTPDMGTNCRVGDFFIVKGTALGGKFHQATYKCTSFETTAASGLSYPRIFGDCISHIKDGDKGLSITGKTGPMFYIAGIWDSGTTYTKNDYKCPVVFLESNERYYYLIASSSINLNPSSNSSVWGLADNFEAIFTKVLFSNFAKLGSFIMNQDWMVSLHGVEYDSSGNLTVVSGDNTTNYLNFKPSSPTENLSGETNFCPNLAIDAKTGRVYAQRMDVGGSSTFKGTVYAENGTFNGSVNAQQFTAGDPTGINITIEDDSIYFNYGGEHRAWFTTKDGLGNNGAGMYLYIKNPDANATSNKVITIDFANLTFKDASGGSQAGLPQENYYSAGTNGMANQHTTIYLGPTDGLYYSNTGCTQLLNNAVYYKKLQHSYFILMQKSAEAKYYKLNIDLYLKITFTNGIASTGTTPLYKITKQGQTAYVYGSSSAVSASNTNVYSNASCTDLYVGTGGNVGWVSGDVYLGKTSSTSGSTYISLCTLLSSNNNASTYGPRERATIA